MRVRVRASRAPNGSIKQHQLRLPDQGAAQGDALGLAAGQGDRPGLSLAGQADLGQRVGGSLPQVAAARPGPAAGREPQRDVGQDPQPRDQPRFLEHDRAVPRDQHLAVVAGIEAAEHP